MSEANEPRFLLIGEAAGDCAARYCFENAEYWAMWNLTMTITRSTLTITRAVCRTHRAAIEGRHWNEVSENFRRSGVAQVSSEPVLNSRPERIAVKRASKWGVLGRHVAKLNDGESIVLKHEGDLKEEAKKISTGLNGIRACYLVRRTVRVVDGKIVITRVGTRQTRGGTAISRLPTA
jgi:hypothetical protein